MGFDMLCAVLDGARPICGQTREGLVFVSSLCRFLGRNAKPGWEADSVELYGSSIWSLSDWSRGIVLGLLGTVTFLVHHNTIHNYLTFKGDILRCCVGEIKYNFQPSMWRHGFLLNDISEYLFGYLFWFFLVSS